MEAEQNTRIAKLEVELVDEEGSLHGLERMNVDVERVNDFIDN